MVGNSGKTSYIWQRYAHRTRIGLGGVEPEDNFFVDRLVIPY